MKFRIFIVLVSFAFTIKAQHSYYSSLNQNLLSVNPAFAGTNKQLRAQAIIGSTGTPKYGYNKQSYYAGVDFLAGKRSGLGLSFSSGTYGKAQKEIQADFSYALHLNIGENLKLAPAFQISYFQITLNRNYVPVSNDIRSIVPEFSDPTLISTKRNMDFSSGLLLYGRRFYVSASVLSFTQPDEGVMGVSKRPMTQIYQGKYKFLDPEKFNIDVYGFIKLQEIVQMHKGQIYSKVLGENFIQYGSYLNYKKISLHLANRLSSISDYNAIVTGVAVNAKGFRVGYNSRYNYATHLSSYFFNEFYLQYAFGRIKKDDNEAQDKSIKLID
jgi:type IX secretion system PorP/SprF family membrane protein